MQSRNTRIPVICVHPTGMDALRLFNPNEWNGESRALVMSCGAEMAAMDYCVSRIAAVCDSAREQCERHFETLKGSWGAAQPERVVVYGQVPEFHVLVEAFYSGIKSLLDLCAQLISTEGVVANRIHGFHKANESYGGSVLNSLGRNASGAKKAIASSLIDLLTRHKGEWIDEVIAARDFFVHPPRGAEQLMFEMRISVMDGTLCFNDAVPPMVGNKPLAEYARDHLIHAKRFLKDFIAVFQAVRS